MHLGPTNLRTNEETSEKNKFKRMRIALGVGFFNFFGFLFQFLSSLFFVSSGMLISSKIMFFDVLSMPEVSWSDPDENWEKLFFMKISHFGPKNLQVPQKFQS